MALMTLLGAASMASAQGTADLYRRMAPVEQYLMDRSAEIALARTAAPDAISGDATVLVLGRHGLETAVPGKNGFVCLVDRGYMGAAFDNDEFWNPKIRGPECMSPPAVRSVLPLHYKRTSLAMAGHSKEEIVSAMGAAITRKELPALEPGAMSYMMSKSAYLTDEGSHNMSHIMFYMPIADGATWGSDLPNSPIFTAPYWYEHPDQRAKGLPPLRLFFVRVKNWSDGVLATRETMRPLDHR
jgi:hypothetical protein